MAITEDSRPFSRGRSYSNRLALSDPEVRCWGSEVDVRVHVVRWRQTQNRVSCASANYRNALPDSLPAPNRLFDDAQAFDGAVSGICEFSVGKGLPQLLDERIVAAFDAAKARVSGETGWLHRL